MSVIKVLGFILRIPKHFSLHFSYFSTILHGIFKFAALDLKELFAFQSLLGFYSLQTSPWPDFEEQKSYWRLDSGELARRRQGGSGGLAPGAQREPVGGSVCAEAACGEQATASRGGRL